MQTKPLTVNVLNDAFPHIEVKGTTSGAVAFLEFKDTKKNLCLRKAILLPADTSLTLSYDGEYSGHSVFFPDSEIDIIFRGHVDTTESLYWTLAFITTRSPTQGSRTVIHGLE